LRMMRRLKIFGLSVAALAFWLMWVSSAQAGWFLDERAFHASAHGRTACLDCHGDIRKRAIHPDPEDVNRTRIDFFLPERCLDCHDGVAEDLAAGRHGRREITDPGKYRTCIRCHKPHTQPGLGKSRTASPEPGVIGPEQCGACHETRPALPAMSAEDEACMACHRLADPDAPGRAEKDKAFCLHCHGTGDTPARLASGKRLPLIDPEAYEDLSHSEVACTICHPQSAQYRHADQQPGDCLQCHRRHHDKVASDAHLTVACAACHLKGVAPVRDPETRRVLWTFDRKPGDVLQLHDMALGKGETSCLRCHIGGNQVGAATMVLPSKSVICMPCHAATFSVGDATTIVSLLVFLFGGVLLVSYWMTGGVPGVHGGSLPAKAAGLAGNVIRAVLSAQGFFIAKALFLDVLLQRRLYRRSRGRWVIHSLIFYPFVFRFIWGMTALCATRWAPQWEAARAMIDKNHPASGILFDISGIVVIIGVVLAFFHGALRDRGQPDSVPRQDRPALLLIGAIVIAGFFLEGMRIAMTGWPAGSGWAFVGYMISLPVAYSPFLTSIYAALWYVHAILTGAFIAYLPFSRLLHIIMAPVSLALNAVSDREHGKGAVRGR